MSISVGDTFLYEAPANKRHLHIVVEKIIDSDTCICAFVSSIVSGRGYDRRSGSTEEENRRQPLGIPQPHGRADLPGQRAAHAPPGAETGWVTQDQVPRSQAHICHPGPAERGGCENGIRDAGTLQRGVHPGHLRPCDHRLPAAGGQDDGRYPLWNSPALTAPRSRMGHGLGQTKTANIISPKK